MVEVERVGEIRLTLGNFVCLHMDSVIKQTGIVRYRTGETRG